MNNRVMIVDYGMGNLYSIHRAIEKIGGCAEITDNPEKIQGADRLILPGVGAFGEGIKEIKARGISDAIYNFVKKGNPLLGICLGMQLLFTQSYEFGSHDGLNLIAGRVMEFRKPEPGAFFYKIPHIGWNSLMRRGEEINAVVKGASDWDGTILAGINPETFFYFIHSFICVPDNSEDVVAESNYGRNRFCSVVNRDNLWGCQFHPERSGEYGLRIYMNFIN